MSFNQEMMINDDILRISRISSASSFIWWFQAPKHQNAPMWISLPSWISWGRWSASTGIQDPFGGFHNHGGSPKWLVCNGNSQSKMDGVSGDLSEKTSIFRASELCLFHTWTTRKPSVAGIFIKQSHWTWVPRTWLPHICAKASWEITGPLKKSSLLH